MYNVIKLSAPFEKLKTYDASPEVSLFKAVIMQHIIDCTNTSNNNESRRLEIEAKTWLFGNSKDFLTVCDFAKISSLEVQKIAKEAIRMHSKARSEMIQENSKNQAPSLKKEDTKEDTKRKSAEC